MPNLNTPDCSELIVSKFHSHNLNVHGANSTAAPYREVILSVLACFTIFVDYT